MMDEIIIKERSKVGQLITDVQYWIKYLIKNWYWFLIMGILGGTIGFMIAFAMPKYYIASTTFVLEAGESADGGIGKYAGIASAMGVDFGGTGGGIFQGDNILELYRSRKMIESALMTDVSDSLGGQVISLYFIEKGKIEVWKKVNPELLDIDFKKGKQKSEFLQRKRDSIITSIVDDINKNYLSVTKPDKKLSIIKVNVKSENERFSLQFNEALVKEVNEFYVQTKTKKSTDNINILQSKADSVRAIMNGAISTAAVVIDNTPNLNPTRQASRIIPTQRAQFSAETNKAILEQIVKNLEMAKMSLLKEAPLLQVVDRPVYPLFIDKLSKLKTALFFAILFCFFTAAVIVFRRLYLNIMK